MNAVATREQFAAANQTAVDTLTNLVTKTFSQVERLTALNLNTARSVLEDSVTATRTVLAAKNPQDLAALQTTLTQPMLDKAAAYGRSVYEIASEGQQEFAKLFETQVAEWNKLFTAALDKAAQSAPAGSGPVFAAVKSALGAANTAYDNISKVAKQVTETAEANIAAATEATVKAASAKKSS
jgi:phasin family protein